MSGFIMKNTESNINTKYFYTEQDSLINIIISNVLQHPNLRGTQLNTEDNKSLPSEASDRENFQSNLNIGNLTNMGTIAENISIGLVQINNIIVDNNEDSSNHRQLNSNDRKLSAEFLLYGAVGGFGLGAATGAYFLFKTHWIDQIENNERPNTYPDMCKTLMCCLPPIFGTPCGLLLGSIGLLFYTLVEEASG